MAEVNYYLKKEEVNTGKSLIYLQFKYSGYRLVFSFGQVIDKKNWNANKQRVKSNSQTTADGNYSLNDLLDELKTVCEKSYKESLKNGIPQPDTIKRELKKFINQNRTDPNKSTLYLLIDRFINNEIKNRGNDKKKSTLNKYRYTLNHLRDFEKTCRYKIDFETINLDFFYKFVSYCQNKGMDVNTIAKYVAIVKTFMNEAFDLGYTSNIQYKSKKFNITWQDTDAIYLKDEEIIKLFNFDFSDNRRLEQVRDLFVFGCFVGLRFSDFSEVKPQNIKGQGSDRFIQIKTQKTGEEVIIPCHPLVIKIFSRYENSPNNLPPSISNQKFNKYLKEACKSAGMNEKGRLISEPEKELWELVSSHTARRSFATNLFLQGYPTIEIMKVTGHKTEKAFLKYIKIGKLETAKKMMRHMQLKWDEKLINLLPE